MPHTTPRETAAQRSIRTSWHALSSMVAALKLRDPPNDRAAERRRTAWERKQQRRQVKREARLYRTVPVEGPTHAAARRARVRASRAIVRPWR